MWSLKAWGQGSGALAYRQVVQRPVPDCGGEGGDAGVADLITAKIKQLRMAHQTKHMSQESAYAMSQGMGTK